MSELTIEKIYGTSSETPAQFVAQDDYIAYTASGGVVVSKVDKELKVQWQKFFCANNVLVTPKTNKLDEYGFPLGGDPELVSRDGSLTAEESRDNLYESPSARTLKIRKSDDAGSSPLANKVRSINCIAISPDKKLLAVGEVGYQPRILVYSLARNCSCRPIYIIQEHQFGINSLCFSTDSKKLCSLGLVNDGFLIVWKFTNKRFVFRGSNKCSSIVNKLFWHDDHIITVGLRHIKVWREDSARAGTILKGRNVLLKNFLNSNFIDIDCLNFSELIVMSDQGDLGLMNLDDESIVLRKIYQLPSDTNQFKIDHIHENVIIGGKELNIIPLNEVFTAPINDTIRPTPSSPTKIVKRSGIMAMQPLFDFETLVYLQDEQILYVDLRETGSPKVLISSLASKLNGLKRCFNGDVLLWTKDGIVKRLENKEFALLHSITLPPGDLLDNALSALDCSSQDLVLGDRFGTLVFLQKREDFIRGYRETMRVRAHESSINDIIMFTVEDYTFAASCSRDRTIQLFMKKGSESWSLFQTLTVHKGNVIKMLFTKNMLIALSSDRTLSVHKLEIKEEGPVLVQEKIISIKTSALTFGVTPDELVVATNDKNILIYSLTTFEYMRSTKLFNKSFDPLQVDNFEIHDGLMFTSSPDKCIRLFHFKDGRLLSSQWGHSETIIGLLFDSDSNSVMTASHDGCMFSWTLGSGVTGSDSFFSSPLTSSNTQDLVSPPKVVRKIISRPELTPMKPSVQNKPSKSPSTVLPAAKLSANDSPTFSRTPSVCSAKQARSISSRSDISPTSNVRSRLAGMRLDKPKPESATDIADKIVMDLRRLQSRLLDDDQINPSLADRLRVQMSKTMKLLPGHDENLLDQYGSALVSRLVDTLRKERDKENLENV